MNTQREGEGEIVREIRGNTILCRAVVSMYAHACRHLECFWTWFEELCYTSHVTSPHGMTSPQKHSWQSTQPDHCTPIKYYVYRLHSVRENNIGDEDVSGKKSHMRKRREEKRMPATLTMSATLYGRLQSSASVCSLQ